LSPKKVAVELTQFLKLLLSFAPWVAFLLIAHDSLLRVKIGLVVAFVLSVVLGVAKVNRGLVLWASLIFFVFATVAVVVLNSLWTVRYMGVLANGTLAAVMWLSVLAGKPFTLEYAKEHVDPSLWKSAAFLRVNNIIASVWGASLTLNTAIAFVKLRTQPGLEITYDVISYATLLGAVAFTTWYPGLARRKETGGRAVDRATVASVNRRP
jgi:hypothetical protein